MTPAPYTLRPAAAGCPVLISVCHAGRAYGPELLGAARAGADVLAQLEDPLVDELAGDARQGGAGLLTAHAPRALVDLNRAPDDLEPSALRGGARLAPTARARIGLGVVPTRLPGTGPLWRAPLPAAEFGRRISGVHRPFHEALARELLRIRDAEGAAVLLDLHSMPPLPDGPEVVVGDRHGSSCAPELATAMAAAIEGRGASVAFNTPYAGGYVVARHGRPARGVHAVQLELSRDLYLDATGRRPGPGWGATGALVGAVVRALAEEAAPRAWARAAE